MVYVCTKAVCGMYPDVAVPAANVTETDRGTCLFVAVDGLVDQCSG